MDSYFFCMIMFQGHKLRPFLQAVWHSIHTTVKRKSMQMIPPSPRQMALMRCGRKEYMVLFWTQWPDEIKCAFTLRTLVFTHLGTIFYKPVAVGNFFLMTSCNLLRDLKMSRCWFCLRIVSSKPHFCLFFVDHWDTACYPFAFRQREGGSYKKKERGETFTREGHHPVGVP